MNADSFIGLIETSGSQLTDANVEVRKLALQRIVASLSLVDTKKLELDQVESLIEFFCAKLADHHSLVPFALRGVYELIASGNFTPRSATRFCNAVFIELHISTLKYAERRCLLSIVGTLTSDKNVLAELRLSFGSPSFANLIAQVVDGERDPRNLLLAFQLLEVVCTNSDLSASKLTPKEGISGSGGDAPTNGASDSAISANANVDADVDESETLFESFACYFPVDFDEEDAAADGVNVTREELSEALQRCLVAHGAFLGLSLELALEKLASSVKGAKIDSLRLVSALLRKFGVGRPVEQVSDSMSASRRTNATEWNKFCLPLLEIIRKEVFYAQSADLETVALDTLGMLIGELSWDEDGDSGQQDSNAQARNVMFTAVMTQLCRTCRTSMFDRDLKLIIPTLKVLKVVCSASQRAALTVADSLLPAFLEKLDALGSTPTDSEGTQSCEHDNPQQKRTELASVLLEFLSEIARSAIAASERQLGGLVLPLRRLLNLVDGWLIDGLSGWAHDPPSRRTEGDEQLRVLAELAQCCAILLRHDAASRSRFATQFVVVSRALHGKPPGLPRETWHALLQLLALSACLFDLQDHDATQFDDVTTRLSAVSTDLLRRTLQGLCGTATDSMLAIETSGALHMIVERLLASDSVLFVGREIPAAALRNQLAQRCFFTEFWPRCEHTVTVLFDLADSQEVAQASVQQAARSDWLKLFATCFVKLPLNAQFNTALGILSRCDGQVDSKCETQLPLLIELAKLLPRVSTADNAQSGLIARHLQRWLTPKPYKLLCPASAGHEAPSLLAQLRALVANKFADDSVLDAHLAELIECVRTQDRAQVSACCLLVVLNAAALRGAVRSVALFELLADKWLADCGDVALLRDTCSALRKLALDIERQDSSFADLWKSTNQVAFKPLFVQRFAHAAVGKLRDCASRCSGEQRVLAEHLVRALFFVVAALPPQVQSLLRTSLLPHCFSVLSALRTSADSVDDAELAGVVLSVLRRFLAEQARSAIAKRQQNDKPKDGCCGGGCKSKEDKSNTTTGCRTSSPSVSQTEFGILCDACLAIALRSPRMRVRLAALECLLQLLDAFPRFYIVPHEKNVVTQLRTCLNDSKRIVREQAWRTRGAWLLAGASDKN